MLETWGSVCSRGFVVGLCFMLLCSHSVYHDDLIVDQSLDTEQIQTSAPEDELTQTLSLQTRLTSQQLSFWPAKSWHKEILEILKPPEEKKTSSLSFSEDTNKLLSVVLLVWSTACAQCAFQKQELTEEVTFCTNKQILTLNHWTVLTHQCLWQNRKCFVLIFSLPGRNSPSSAHRTICYFLMKPRKPVKKQKQQWCNNGQAAAECLHVQSFALNQQQTCLMKDEQRCLFLDAKDVFTHLSVWISICWC